MAILNHRTVVLALDTAEAVQLTQLLDQLPISGKVKDLRPLLGLVELVQTQISDQVSAEIQHHDQR